MAAAEVTAVMVGEVAVTDLAGEVLAVMVVGGTACKVTSVGQSKLSERGYYHGPIDGVIGAGSRLGTGPPGHQATDPRKPAFSLLLGCVAHNRRL